MDTNTNWCPTSDLELMAIALYESVYTNTSRTPWNYLAPGYQEKYRKRVNTVLRIRDEVINNRIQNENDKLASTSTSGNASSTRVD